MLVWWRKDLLIIHPCGANSACEINLPCRSKIIVCRVVVFTSIVWLIVVCGVYFALWVELQIAASVACKLLSWVVFLLLCGFVGHVKIHGRSDASYSWPGPVIGMCYQVTDWCGFGLFLTRSLLIFRCCLHEIGFKSTLVVCTCVVLYNFPLIN